MPTIFDTYIDITPVATGWQTLDISSHVPATCEIAIIAFEGNGGGQTWDAREPGDAYTNDLDYINPSSFPNKQIFYVPVDEDRYIDVYSEDISKVDAVTLMGYLSNSECAALAAMAEVSFTRNATFVSVDLSSHVPEGTTCAIVRVQNQYSGGRAFYRATGSSAELFERRYMHNNSTIFMKLDGSRTFECKAWNHTKTRIFVIGYLTNDSGMKTDPTAINPTRNSWQTEDLSADAPASAEYAIIRYQYSAAAAISYKFDVRKVGSSEDMTKDVTNLASDQLVELNGSDEIQVFVEHANAEAYIVGYTEASVPTNPNTFSGAPSFNAPMMTMDAGMQLPGSMGDMAGTFPLPIGASAFAPEASWILPLLRCAMNGFYPDTVNFTFQMMQLAIDAYNVSEYMPLDFPLMTLEGSGITGEVGVVEGATEIPDFDAVWHEVGSITVTFPIELTITMLSTVALPIDASHPLPTMTSTALTGEIGSVVDDIPMLDLDIPYQQMIIMEAEAIRAALTMVVGEIGDIEFTHPFVEIEPVLVLGTAYGIDITLHDPKLDATLLVGQIGSLAEQFRATFLSNGLTGQVGSIDETLKITLSTDLYGSYPATITMTLPLIRSEGYLYETLVQNLSTFMVHLKSGAVTEVEYPFLEMAYNNQNYLGCNANGLYVIGGNKFNGANIDAFFETGRLDLGMTELKRLTDGYLTLKNAGTYKISLKTDDGSYNAYTMTDASALTHTEKIQFGRGAKGKYWQVKFENQSGADFEIQNFELIAQILRKKMRGK